MTTTFERGEGGTWFRRNADGDRYFAASKTDNSPVWKHYISGNYNPECSCCWLGFGHTTAIHETKLSK